MIKRLIDFFKTILNFELIVIDDKEADKVNNKYKALLGNCQIKKISFNEEIVNITLN